MATTTSAKISESVYSDSSLRVDEEAGIIHNVRIIGRESLNGRRYSDQALDDGARLYEGRDVMIDHVEPDQHNPQRVASRGLLEGWGVLKGTRRNGDEVRGDLHYLKTHAATPALVERAKRFPLSFGLSHDAEGKLSPGKLGSPAVVESLERVESVDLVRKPATNRGLFEEQRQPTPAMKKTPLKQLLGSLVEAKHAGGTRLAKLLEEDGGLVPSADMPVETADAAGPDDQLGAAIRAMVNAVLDDASLDASAKMAKIKTVLQAQDKLSKQPEPKGGTVDTTNAVAESVLKELQAMKRDQAVRDILEGAGLVRASLTDGQKKLLESVALDQLPTLVESWPKPVSAPTGPKPRVGSALREQHGQDDYETMRKQLRRRQSA